MLRNLTLAVAAIAAAHLAAAEQPVVTATSPIRIWVDQIGYRAIARKIAVVASDNELPAGIEIELRDVATGKPVWILKDHGHALTPFNGGKKDPDSGDFVAQLDFTDFSRLGRYEFVLITPGPMRSYKFNIANNPYYDAGIAAWKAFYYNRADGEKSEKYAGIWNHGKAFLGPNQATEAKVYKWKVGNRWPDSIGTEIVDPKTYDVHGGWWDAGDFNKYTSNTVLVQNSMLMVYEMTLNLPVRPKDSELNIPESGNGIPDVLDEIRVGTDFLIRDSDGTGAAFGRVHQDSGSPPDTVMTPVQLTMPNSDTTMGRACALAYAAVVWRESKLDAAYAQKCLDESMKSWNLLLKKPNPWPPDPTSPSKILNQGEMPGLEFGCSRATAAACYFRLTGKKEYDTIVHEYFAAQKWVQGKAFDSGGQEINWPLMWIYIHTKGADPALAENLKQSILATADATVHLTGVKRAYGMGIRGYWWGSNSLIGRTGGLLVTASMLTDDKDKKKAYLEGAEEYVHYLYGRNPIGVCYFSNMRSFGAERSAMVMFHGWVGRDGSALGAKYIGEGEGKIGPFPGMVVGGVNGSMKKYVESLDWRKNPWEFTEPDIAYQISCCQLLCAFTWRK